jgi:hypothetical protein
VSDTALDEFAEAVGRWVMEAGADRGHGLAEVAVVVRGADGMVAVGFVTSSDGELHGELKALLANGWLMTLRTEGNEDDPL